MTRDELRGLPVAVDLVTAGRALGIGRTLAYELAARGDFPVPVRRIGTRWRCVTADLHDYLRVTPDMRTAPVATDAAATTTDPEAPGVSDERSPAPVLRTAS